MNNNNETQNARFLRTDGQSRCYWGAGVQNMTIINRREKSSVTAELGRRFELLRPGATRPQWNIGLGSEIYFTRRPEEDERKDKEE